MQSLKGCTVLFITHRLSSIVNADLIVCMGNGTVLEAGTHQELMEARGAYYVLYRQLYLHQKVAAAQREREEKELLNG
jgi:ATP-binding cassette subfamily B protein